MQNTLSFYVSYFYKDFLSYTSNKLKTLDLSYGQLPFILYIGKKSNCTQAEMTNRLKVDWGHSQRTITKLADNGFVTKSYDANDKSYHLNLTAKGNEAFILGHEVFKEWDDDVLKNLNVEEREQLLELLKKIIPNIK